MKSDIHVCDDWRTHHDRPVYTLGDTCPACGGPAVNSAPAPFDPTDRYGDYRRRRKRKRSAERDGDASHRDHERDDDAQDASHRDHERDDDAQDAN